MCNKALIANIYDGSKYHLGLFWDVENGIRMRLLIDGIGLFADCPARTLYIPRTHL
jgi:hypothetical protein